MHLIPYKNLLESVSAHVYAYKFNHLANSIHSSMNSLETDNEYFPKPTSVRNRPGYIRTATDGVCSTNSVILSRRPVGQ